MATTEQKIETTTNHVRNANADEEKILVEKVAPLFTDEDVKLAALRYGRKLLRFKAGARSSTPPLGTLTPAMGATIAKALGIELKTKKAPAKAKAAEKSSGDVKPDPKPARKPRASSAKKTKAAA